MAIRFFRGNQSEAAAFFNGGLPIVGIKMDTLLSYLISLGLIAFGISIVVIATKTASGSLLAWTLMASIPVVVGTLSLFSEMRNDGAD
jgi:hypothetical protein